MHFIVSTQVCYHIFFKKDQHYTFFQFTDSQGLGTYLIGKHIGRYLIKEKNVM